MPGIGPFSFGGSPPRQDFVELGGKKSPGVCAIMGAGTPRNWDIRQGYGFAGAFCVFTGTSLAKFDIVLNLWEDEHWDKWADFSTVLALPPKPTAAQLANILSIPTSKPKALSIKHPILVTPPLNITSVVIEDVSQPMQDDDGLWTIVIKCLEFRAPQPINLKKPDQDTGAVKKPELTAADPDDVAIQALRAQRDALAK